jgi:hypothetical protein
VTAPAWVDAAIDQRMAMMEEVAASMPPDFPIILTTLTEPAPFEQFDHWERTCDNCGTHCPDDTPFYTGQASRDWHGRQVIISFGACPKCAGVPS